jgi:hypothetical protein
MKNKLWIVGQWVEQGWEFVGVYDTKKQAKNACKNNTYFMGPARLNQTHHDSKEWVGAYFPTVLQ